MGNQFKVGDLAMITIGKNFGCVVTLISFHTEGRVYLKSGMYTDVYRPEWRVEGDSLVARLGHRIAPVKDGLIEPRYLMPLRGEFEPEKQKQREAEPCA